MSNNCKPCSDNFYNKISSNPGSLLGGGKTVNITAGTDDIKINKTENSSEVNYEISYAPYIPLQILSFTDNIPLQVKGATVDDFTLNWTLNKPIDSQSLNQGLTAPQPTASLAYSLAVTGQGITEDTVITLTADDDSLDSNSSKSSNNSILFSNKIYRTQVAINDRGDIDADLINGLDLTAITNYLQRTRALTFTAESLEGEYEVILIPTSYGLTSGAQFKDVSTGFTGGWSKITDLSLTDINGDSTFSLTNEEGFSELYDVWVSLNDHFNGLTFQIN